VTVNGWPAIVTEPVRCDAPVLAATFTPTVPLPLPVAPELTLSQAELLVALQAQLLSVFTDTATGSPAADDVCVPGEIEKAHGAACVTVKVWPATVTVPVRSAPAFAATATLTVPFPVPVPPLATVSHAALLVALQAQVLPAVTPTLAVSPAAGELRFAGEIA
jgi:hypothetical protein